jgi:hypothetical protein
VSILSARLPLRLRPKMHPSSVHWRMSYECKPRGPQATTQCCETAHTAVQHAGFSNCKVHAMERPLCLQVAGRQCTRCSYQLLGHRKA